MTHLNNKMSLKLKQLRVLLEEKRQLLKKNFSGRFKPHWSAKSIASLSLREVAREAGIAPNSFYRHFKDIDELAISLIDRAGIVLRKIIRQARLRASLQESIIRSSVDIFLQQLDADEGNLSLLLRESFTGSASYKAAVDRQLNFFSKSYKKI